MRVAVAVVLLAASSHAAAEFPGFKHERLDEHLWAVRMVGSGFSNQLRVAKKLRCKASELGSKNGYSYMTLHDAESGTQGGAAVFHAVPSGNGAMMYGGQVQQPVAQAVAEFSTSPMQEGQRSIIDMRKIWGC